MKTRAYVRKAADFLWLVIATCIPSVSAGGEFINLDFEEATVAPTPPGGYDREYRPVSHALPGWRAYYGENEVSEVSHNRLSLGKVDISLFGPHFFEQFILEGDYTVFLGPGSLRVGSGYVLLDTSISQTGLVPGDAASLRFKIGPPRATVVPNQFQVFMNEQALPMAIVDQQPKYTEFAADVAPYAGQTVELEFVAYFIPRFGNAVWLDSFEFSPEPIPEPGVAGLLALGALVVLWDRWRRYRRRA